MKADRINPAIPTSEGQKIVTFRDGPHLIPAHLASFAARDSVPEMSYQEWVRKVANRQMERRFVSGSIQALRLSHFAR